QDAAETRHIVSRIEDVPAPTEIGLEPRCEIARTVGRLGAHVAEIAGAVARRNVHAAAQSDRQVRVVAAHAALFGKGVERGLAWARVLVAEFDAIVREVA